VRERPQDLFCGLFFRLVLAQGGGILRLVAALRAAGCLPILPAMPSDDDAQFENTPASTRPPVPKLPFLLADAALVGTALMISSATDGLSTLQLFFCLGLVVFGAIIFATPYVLERFPAINWNFFAGNDSTSGQSGTAANAESEWQRQARAAAEAIEHAVRANAALESSARRFDARFAPLVEVQQGLAVVLAELREAAAARTSEAEGGALAVQREFERMRKEQAEKFKVTEEKIAALGETLTIFAVHLKAISTRPGLVAEQAEAPRPRAKASAPIVKEESSAVQTAGTAMAGSEFVATDAPAAASVAKAALASTEGSDSGGSQVSTLVQADAPILGTVSITPVAPEQQHTIEPSSREDTTMLAKALSRAQSSGQTPAVAGIIMARARRPKKSKPPMPVDDAASAATVESAPVSTPEPVAAPAALEEPAAWQSLTEGKFDAVTVGELAPSDATLSSAENEAPPAKTEGESSGDTSSAFRRSARAKAVALRGEEEEAARKDTPVVFAPGRAKEPGDQAIEGPTQGELLAREAETIRKRRSSRSPVSACVLTVRVLIGIGNKPFVRGTGPGLSNEKGVPMEFVEIGQWRWVAPSSVKEPITLRILKNDEVPAEGDPIVIHPGQSVDFSPVFPG
jgi:hypothetical protein